MIEEPTTVQSQPQSDSMLALKGYEELQIRNNSMDSLLCPVFKVQAMTYNGADLEFSNEYRSTNEKFDRVFYHKNYTYICRVDGKTLQISVASTRKSTSPQVSETAQRMAIIKFDCSIVRDLFFIDFQDEFVCTGILLVPLAIGSIYQLALTPQGLRFSKDRNFPDCRIFYLFANQNTHNKQQSQPIIRMEDLRLENYKSERGSYLDVAVLHQGPGIYLYKIKLDDTALLKSSQRNRPEEISLNCLKHVTLPQSILGSLSSGFFGRSQDVEQDTCKELCYIRNDMVVTVTSQNQAQLRSLFSGEILTSVQLPELRSGFSYQIGNSLLDPCRPNTIKRLNFLVVIAQVPVNPEEHNLQLKVEDSDLFLWKLSLQNVLHSEVASLADHIFEPKLFSKAGCLAAQHLETKTLNNCTVLSFNRCIDLDLFISVYNHSTCTSEILAYNIESQYGLQAENVTSSTDKLMIALIEDYVISESTSIRSRKEYLLESMFTSCKFSGQILKKVFQSNQRLGPLMSQDLLKNIEPICKHLLYSFISKALIKDPSLEEELFPILQAATALKTSSDHVTYISCDSKHGNLPFTVRADGSIGVMLRTEEEQTLSDILSLKYWKSFSVENHAIFMALRYPDSDKFEFDDKYVNFKMNQIKEISQIRIEESSSGTSEATIISDFRLDTVSTLVRSHQELILLDVLDLQQRMVRLPVKKGAALMIRPISALEASVIDSSEDEIRMGQSWLQTIEDIMSKMIAHTPQEELLSYFSEHSEHYELMQAYYSSNYSMYIESLKNQNQIRDLPQSRLTSSFLKHPPLVVLATSSLIQRFSTLGLEVITQAVTHSHILQLTVSPLPPSGYSPLQKTQLSLQPYLAISRLTKSIIKSQQNISDYYSSPALKHLTSYFEEIPISLDISIQFYDNCDPKHMIESMSSVTREDNYSWLNSTANYILDQIVMEIPSEDPNFMKGLSQYCLQNLSEVDNFGLVVTSLRSENTFYKYCRMVWALKTGRSQLARSLLYGVVLDIQTGKVNGSRTNESWFVRGPWFYLHGGNGSKYIHSTPNLNIFFDTVFQNLKNLNKEILGEVADQIKDLEHVNFSVKKQYVKAFVESRVHSKNFEAANRIIMELDEPCQREELYSWLIKMLVEKQDLNPISEIFMNNSEAELIKIIIWEKINKIEVNLRSSIMKGSSFIIIENNLNLIRRYYTLIYKYYFKTGDYKEAGSVYWDMFKIIACLFQEYSQKMGKRTKLEVLKVMSEGLNGSLTCLEIEDVEGELGYCNARFWRERDQFNYTIFTSFIKKHENLQNSNSTYNQTYIQEESLYRSVNKSQSNPSQNKMIVQNNQFINIKEIETLISLVNSSLLLETQHLQPHLRGYRSAPILGYLSLNKIESAISYSKYNKETMPDLAKVLVSLLLQNNQSSSHQMTVQDNEKSNSRIWSNIMVCVEQLDDSLHSNKLTFLGVLLAVQQQYSKERCEIFDGFDKLLLDSCPLQYANYLQKYGFLEDCMDILERFIGICLQEINAMQLVIRKVSDSKSFDPYLLQKIIRRLSARCNRAQKHDIFESFYSQFKEKLSNLTSIGKLDLAFETNQSTLMSYQIISESNSFLLDI